MYHLEVPQGIIGLGGDMMRETLVDEPRVGVVAFRITSPECCRAVHSDDGISAAERYGAKFSHPTSSTLHSAGRSCDPQKRELWRHCTWQTSSPTLARHGAARFMLLLNSVMKLKDRSHLRCLTGSLTCTMCRSTRSTESVTRCVGVGFWCKRRVSALSVSIRHV